MPGGIPGSGPREGEIMRFIGRLRNRSGTAATWRRRKRRTGLRTWTRAVGTSGLTSEAEAWVKQIGDEMRSAVFGWT